jgi:benzodiazapine receptor
MKLRQVLNIVVFILVVAVNGLANSLPINNQTTGEISDSYPVMFTPAGYVFSIWGVIYLGLLGFVIYQALPGQRDNPRLERVGYWFVWSCVFNSIWIFLWHYELMPWSVLVMAGILASLILVYLRLEIGRSQVPAGETLLARLPFSIYLGWISVATIANVSVLLYSLGWDRFGLLEQVITVILLAIGSLLGFLMARRHADVAYPLVLAWAFAGIVVNQAGFILVGIAAGVAAVGMLAAALFALLLRRRTREAISGI